MENEIINILIVDDDEDICWVIKKVFRQDNFFIKCANNGAQALALITKFNFNVAILDAKLPDIDGLSLATLTRQTHPYIQIIIISGYYTAEDEIILEGIKKGSFDFFVSKPFELDTLRQVIQQQKNLLD
ncbi:MAG: response regulator [Chloroflexi bacterium]|nr:response regulator [Chloroflexota bacterium]